MLAPQLAAAILVATVALVTDVRSRRIPNWLTGGAVLLGLGLNGWLNGPSGLLLAVAGAGIGLLLLFPFYLVRAMGAGDVKLLAAIGALGGPQFLLGVALAGALVGGVQSIIILARRGTLSLAFHQIFAMRTRPAPSGAKAPYAVAIAAGVYITSALRLVSASPG